MRMEVTSFGVHLMLKSYTCTCTCTLQYGGGSLENAFGR